MSASAPTMASGSAAAIRGFADDHDAELVRVLFREYAQWLGVDLCFQGFDHELKTLPGAYSVPLGRLLVAGAPNDAFACIALRPLGAAGPSAAMVGEVKRLYVRPTHRGQGWGGRLATKLVDEARVIGYRTLKLDTLEWMKPARSLYARLGFRECAPYYDNPLPGVVYMQLEL